MWTDAVSRGWNGSLTSYCLSSPVPLHDTYSQRSSTDRSMSETSGGTAPKGCSAGGRSSAWAGSAGMVITLSTDHRDAAVGELPSRYRKRFKAIMGLPRFSGGLGVQGCVPASDRSGRATTYWNQ